jgi:hypothetical protein
MVSRILSHGRGRRSYTVTEHDGPHITLAERFALTERVRPGPMIFGTRQPPPPPVHHENLNTPRGMLYGMLLGSLGWLAIGVAWWLSG